MTAIECRRCSRNCTLFICHTCTENLRQELRDLPWWLDRLIEAAVGQVKLSDGGRRAKRSSTLHGDDTPASHIEPYRTCKCEEGQCDCDTRKARRTREHDAMAHILAAGKSNARASDELQKIHNTLTHWIQGVCETRGVDTPTLHTAHGMARWLAKHAQAVAGQEDAERCCDDIAVIIKRAERIINRPIPPRYLGPCRGEAPEPVIRKRWEVEDYETRCNRALTASANAESVTCPQCESTYVIEEVIRLNLIESGDKLMTVRELVDWVLPQLDEAIPQKTLEAWIRRGWVPTRGVNAAGHQMVRLSDVREAWARRPRNAKRAG